MYKIGHVGIVGKPNVGKSTLINKLIGEKVSIVAPKPQTTRFNVRGVMTTDKSQIVFVDTAGIHNPKNKMNEYMMKGVKNTSSNVDILVFMVDAKKPRLDKDILKNIVKFNKRCILCVNKIDRVAKANILKIIDEYVNYAKELNFEFLSVIPISVYNREGLDVLVKTLEDNLNDSEELMYDKDYFTDMTEREIVEENVREKFLRKLSDEVPHGLNVDVVTFKERVNVNNDLVYDILADVIVSRKTHKTIVLGKDGALLRHITNTSRRELKEILGVNINLKLHVKVRENWEKNDNFLKNIKYRNFDK